MSTYKVVKTYGHDKGFSCAFRQWSAESHCSYIHGYSLGFTVTIGSDKLNEQNWVYDFGDFNFLEDWLREHFDHTLLVAINDPYKDEIKSLDKNKIARIVEVPEISCEKFAEMTFKFIDNHFNVNGYNVKVLSVEVSEHPGNTAGYYGE
tara:strand:- start:243 stop:689 length:447 start_codon:yes stop_codon:yes gene_type:complete